MRVFHLPLIFAIAFVSAAQLSVTAQSSRQAAVVISDTAFLRVDPWPTSEVSQVLKKGAKLHVVRLTLAKGWYVASLDAAPTVVGCIHGDSIRIVGASIQKKPVVQKRTTNVAPPKNINLIDGDLPVGIGEVQPGKLKTAGSARTGKSATANFCKPPLFCPDIDEVQVSIFDNSNKFEKGKFEKTLDFERRRKNIANEIKLSSGHTLADKMYFLYDYGTMSLTYSTAQYDADKERWTFDVDYREMPGGTCIPILSQRAGQELCLIVEDKLRNTKKATVSMPPAIAAANERKVDIAFGGHLISPYVWGGAGSPAEGILSGLHFKLEDVILVNPQSGQQWKVEIEKPIAVANPVGTESDLSIYRKVLAADPQNAEAYLGLGRAYSKLGEQQSAINALKTAIYWKNNLITAHVELGKLYFVKGEYVEAYRYVNSALAIEPSNEDALRLRDLIPASIRKPIAEDADAKRTNISEPKYQPLEGKWKVSIENGTNKSELLLDIYRSGKKFKAFLSNAAGQTSKTFDFKTDGTDFKFELSWTEYFVSKTTVKVSGKYDGYSLSGQLAANRAGQNLVAIFKGIPFSN